MRLVFLIILSNWCIPSLSASAGSLNENTIELTSMAERLRDRTRVLDFDAAEKIKQAMIDLLQGEYSRNLDTARIENPILIESGVYRNVKYTIEGDKYFGWTGGDIKMHWPYITLSLGVIESSVHFEESETPNQFQGIGIHRSNHSSSRIPMTLRILNAKEFELQYRENGEIRVYTRVK